MLAMELLEGLSSRDNVNVWGVLPSQAERLVARTTTDRDLLLDCAELGRQDMRDALARPPHPAPDPHFVPLCKLRWARARSIRTG